MMKNVKRIIILIINAAFYAICDIKHLPVMALEIVGTYLIYCRILQSKRKKMWLAIGVSLEIIILCYFKYAWFFKGRWNTTFRLLMPLGISYYTFKIMSFLIDAYRGKNRSQVSLIQYAAYVSFFAQIICGPISRADEIIPYFDKKVKLTDGEKIDGIGMILSGLFKKIAVADRLSPYINTVFENPQRYPALAGWIAAFLFSIQIYCDFAGYSEMSIGVCKLLGFNCKENFNKPYFSANAREFWDKWHISLSTWLRDYVYIPLGGNRLGKARKYLNVMATFLISGIWHGNGLNYIVWGVYHGILNIVPVKKAKNKALLCLQILITFICVTFGWIMFRAESLAGGVAYIQNMFRNLSINYSIIVDSIRPFTGDYSCMAYFLVNCMLIFMLFIFELRDYTGSVKSHERSMCVRGACYLAATILFGVVGQSSFLYANF